MCAQLTTRQKESLSKWTLLIALSENVITYLPHDKIWECVNIWWFILIKAKYVICRNRTPAEWKMLRNYWDCVWTMPTTPVHRELELLSELLLLYPMQRESVSALSKIYMYFIALFFRPIIKQNIVLYIQPEKGLKEAQVCSPTENSRCVCPPGMFCSMGFDDPFCIACSKYRSCRPGFGVSIQGTETDIFTVFIINTLSS